MSESNEPTNPSTDQLSFEQAIDQLEGLIEKIESGEVGLEEALQHYEQGTALIKRCRSILDAAEKRIAELTESESGELQIEQGEAGEDESEDAG
jgi:exodeoxyribonuclease VII small subunit